MEVSYWKANFSRLLLIIRRSRRRDRRIRLKFFIREQSTPHFAADTIQQLSTWNFHETFKKNLNKTVSKKFKSYSDIYHP